MRYTAAVVTMALLVTAGPASAEPWTAGAFVLGAGPRYGMHTNHGIDPWGFGGGITGGYTFPFAFSFQIEADCFVGDRRHSLCQAGWGPGYDIGLGPVVLRPNARAGLAFVTNSLSGLFLNGGASILYAIESFVIGLDGRYERVGLPQPTESIVVGLNLGFTFRPRRRTPRRL
jgi:hypothetical protein